MTCLCLLVITYHALLSNRFVGPLETSSGMFTWYLQTAWMNFHWEKTSLLDLLQEIEKRWIRHCIHIFAKQRSRSQVPEPWARPLGRGARLCYVVGTVTTETAFIWYITKLDRYYVLTLAKMVQKVRNFVYSYSRVFYCFRSYCPQEAGTFRRALELR